MINKYLYAILIVFLSCTAVLADESISVLILDKGLQKTPQKNEELVKLDNIKGRLRVGENNYRGELEIFQGKKGLYVINKLPLEEYVEGVVTAETGRDWADEALKAQAVIVRTYVLYQKLQNSSRQFHVTSSVLHQVYKGQNSDNKVSSAVKETKGEILVFEEKPILAYYHSTSCGKTELPEEVFGQSFPYLKSVESSGKLSPYNLWTRRIPIEEIEKATDTKGLSEVKIKTRTSTGRAKEVALLKDKSGRIENKTVLAKDLRKMLGWKRLPSTDFDVRMESDVVVFEGSGYGHGVGLCQWTALEMAKEGKNYREILSHFYPGTMITLDENLEF